MRQLEGFQSFLDNYGDPLVGRLRFFDKTTSAAANVYDSEGTSLGTIVYTDTAGRLAKQVFLADNTDYLVLVDKFVGNGAMVIDDEDLSPSEAYEAREELESNFLNIGSFVNLYNTLNIHVETEGVQCVETIEDLMDIQPNTVANGVICLLGYYEAGDKSPVYYLWDGNSTEADNGGTIICPEGRTTAGRWILVTGDTLDSRDFGIKPMTNPAVGDDDHKTRVQAFVSAANGHKKLYFASWKYYGGSSFFYDVAYPQAINYGMCGTDVKLVNSGTHTTLTDCDKTVKVYQVSAPALSGSFAFIADTLYTSQFSSCNIAQTAYYCDTRFSPRERMVFDNTNYYYDNQLTITGKDCLFQDVAHVNLYMENCKITSSGMLKAEEDYPITFHGCTVDEAFFNTNNDLDYCTFEGYCQLGVWESFDFAYKVSPTYIDSQEGVECEDNITISADSVFKRVAFSGNVTIDEGKNVIFESCSFAGNCGGSGYTTTATATFHKCATTGEATQLFKFKEVTIDFSELTTARIGFNTSSYLSNSKVKEVYMTNNSNNVGVEMNDVELENLIATNQNPAVSLYLRDVKLTGSQAYIVVDPNGNAVFQNGGSCQCLMSGGVVDEAPVTRDDSNIIYSKGLQVNKVLKTQTIRRTILDLTSLESDTQTLIDESGTTSVISYFYIKDSDYEIGDDVLIYYNFPGADQPATRPSRYLRVWRDRFHDVTTESTARNADVYAMIEIKPQESVRVTKCQLKTSSSSNIQRKICWGNDELLEKWSAVDPDTGVAYSQATDTWVAEQGSTLKYFYNNVN